MRFTTDISFPLLRHSLALLLLVLVPCVAVAQQPLAPSDSLSASAGLSEDEIPLQGKARLNVRGTVFENQSLKPLPDATVKLTDKNGKLVAGALTKENGQYVLPAVPAGTYTLRVSFMGYQEQTFAVTLPEKAGNFKVNDVLMREATTMMTEAVVEGQMPEMTVVDDTVMYNADAFKLPEGSVVEDLIKKLPGIEVDENGKYTWNGKEISQILLDGKEFFGRNMGMTLQNLPADIIDKIKAYDRKSDRARDTGIDDGEEHTVLDLTVKKDKKRGWLGNFEGGYGTEDRYRGRTMVNRFIGEQKYSFVGNVGNNEGNGMTDHQSVGFTMNYDKKGPDNKDKLELNGGVNANFSQGQREATSSTQSFVNTSSAFSNGHSQSDNFSRAVEANYKVEWKVDSMTKISVHPTFNYNESGLSSRSDNATFRKDPFEFEGITDPLAQIMELPKSARVNHRVNMNHSASSSISGNLNARVTRRMKKDGRNITLDFDAGIGANESDGDNFSHVDYYRIKAKGGGDSIYHKAQYNDADNKQRNVRTKLSYNEPLADRLFLQLSYQYSYNFRDNNRTVSTIFDPYNVQWGVDYDNYRDFRSQAPADTAQCNYTTSHYQSHMTNVQLNLIRTLFRMTVGVDVTPQFNEVNYTKGYKHHEVKRHVVNAAPTLNFRYRFSRQESLDVRYRSQTGQPTITDLIPDTLNNTNPLNVRLGNPGLKPSFTQTFNANYNRSVPKLQRSLAATASFNTTQNSVSNMTQYDDETGGRVTRPENINGNWSGNVGVNFNTAFRRNQHFHFNTNSQGSMTNSLAYVYISKEKATRKARTRGLNASESVRFSYRNDWLDVNLNSSFRYHHSSSTNTNASKLDTYRYTYGGGVQVQMPWGMTCNMDITQASRRGYSDASMNTDELLWNFSLSQRLLPKKNLVISLRAVDVLDRRAEVTRNITATARTDTRTRNIHSYYMLSVNYRFGQFGGKGKGKAKAAGKDAGKGAGKGAGPKGQGEKKNNRIAGRPAGPRGSR